ncbi:hypothetical protein FKM82_028401 [Ascaphus truei]
MQLIVHSSLQAVILPCRGMLQVQQISLVSGVSRSVKGRQRAGHRERRGVERETDFSPARRKLAGTVP